MPSILAQTTPLNDLPPWVGPSVVFALALAWGLWWRRRQVRRAAETARTGARSPGEPTPADRLQPTSPSLYRRVLTGVLVQAVIWAALSVAFAALLRLAGPQSWPNALRFAALNWMPWAVLAPAVFWYSGRFPLERGHLWRSVPAHIIGCAACVSITVWIAAYVGYATRPSPGHFESRRFERPPDHERSEPSRDPEAAAAASDSVRPAPNLDRPPRAERFAHSEARGPFGRRGGPGWWPLLGTMLLRANFDAAVYLIVIFAAHAVSFYRRAQERGRHAALLAAGLHRAKLDALRLQLQPHFLFNTLNAISTLVHRDATAADELIGDLSDLLRISLQTTDDEVPLVRELELLDRYLAIEQARLGTRLSVVREIDPAAANALVPTFLLQPLVENAIRHGIEPRLAPGTVTLRAQRTGDRLTLVVADNGVGLAGAGQPHRRGIGITNTEERLRALHGDSAVLTLKTPSHGGVEVEISLPYSTTARALPANAAGVPAAPQAHPSPA